jgi:hypothetical protein
LFNGCIDLIPVAAGAAAGIPMDSGRSNGAGPVDTQAVIVPNEDGDDTENILRAAHDAKCGDRPMTFLAGTYTFQFKSCPRSAGIACDPNARLNDHPVQSWVFDTDKTVEPIAFLGWNELLGKGYFCGDPISGVKHNFYELKVKDLLTGSGRDLRPIAVGDFMRPPPESAPRVSTAAVQVIAQWWSRFGTPWLQERGQCASYDPCDHHPCKDEQGRTMGRFGPVDYTWEWNHENADRVDREVTCGTGSNAYTRAVRDEPETGLTVDYPMPYQAKRHPMLGWYRDNDPIILDWISYWLKAYGVDAVLINSPAPLVRTNWVKVLFEDAPNFSNINFAKWMPWRLRGAAVPAYADCPDSTTTAPGQRGCYGQALLREWKAQLDETYFDPKHSRHVFIVNKRDDRGVEKRYPLVAVWKGNELRRNMASIRYECRFGERSPWKNGMCLRPCVVGDEDFGRCGLYETRYFFRKVAELFRAKGYDGVAIAVQNLQPRNRLGLEYYPWKELENDAGVLYVDGLYMGTENNVVDKSRAPRYSYDAFRRFAVEQYDQIVRAHTLITVPTDLEKRQPHRSSTRAISGSSPEGFWCWLDAVTHQLVARKMAGEPLPWDRPAVAVYNVSEWIEAGASLQPNVFNGFAYLEAVERLKEKYSLDLKRLPVVDPSCTDG